jgi:lipopolysaccharide biosynthesis glycosyltransferase
MPSKFNTLSSFVNSPSVFNEAKIVHFIGHNKPWALTVSDAFHDYVKRHIGLVNCSFLFTKYKNYKEKTLTELKKHGIY